MKIFKRLEESMWGEDENGERIYYLWGKPGEAVYDNKRLGRRLKILNNVLLVLFFMVVMATIYLVSEEVISLDESDLIVNFSFLIIPIIFLIELYLMSKNCKFYLVSEKKRKRKSIKTWIYFSIIPILMLLDLNTANDGFFTKTLPAILLCAYILGIYTLAFFIKKTKGYIFNK